MDEKPKSGKEEDDVDEAHCQQRDCHPTPSISE
jgi:uncharacterized protein YkwD